MVLRISGSQCLPRSSSPACRQRSCRKALQTVVPTYTHCLPYAHEKSFWMDTGGGTPSLAATSHICMHSGRRAACFSSA